MKRTHILVVDDDAGLVSLLEMRLKSTGYDVDSAETGWDGLTKLERADYDVVLLDYMMPGDYRLDGFTTHPCASSIRPGGHDDQQYQQ